ncbi:MAG: YdeI/OmpD-associated family protein [Flavobacteriales bacterium]|nr:YdeI/OmpD-associated family protein [Flavobacteriales bacterium]
MERHQKVEAFVEKQSKWKEATIKLREIALESGMEETVKWGGPVYTVNGKNIVGIGAFKAYVALWFWQGALLKDEQKKLVNAQEGVTKALRQWRFASTDEIDRDLVKAYIMEAIDNQKAGKTVKIEKKKEVIIPPKLASALAADERLKEQFEAFSPYKQREFAEHIAEAKREETQDKRLEKSIPMILDGIGLHDKYRKA